MTRNPQVAYVVFERFPAPKGAAVHVEAFARALGGAFGPVALLTLPGGTSALPPPPEDWSDPAEPWPGVTHQSAAAWGGDLVARCTAFRGRLARWFRELGGRRVPVVHFRSIFEGYPIARHKRLVCDKLVFEVNGLPSIELKYHYPAVADDAELQAKLIAQEQTCIDAADLIVTPSAVTADHLVARGASRSRVRVIPNGVDPALFSYAAPRALEAGREIRLLYSGTLAAWQGVFRAVEALALLRRDLPASLTLVGPSTRRQRRDVAGRAESLGVGSHVRLVDPVPQQELCALYHRHHVALAPLPHNDRNVVQGCCPLKVLEAMAAGTPLVASDLPVVSALAANGAEALLVRPGSAKAIKDGVLRLVQEPGLGAALAEAARARVEREFTWERARERLIDCYEEVLGVSRSNTRRSAAASTAG